jgi:hypothetical protein
MNEKAKEIKKCSPEELPKLVKKLQSSTKLMQKNIGLSLLHHHLPQTFAILTPNEWLVSCLAD